MERLKVVVTDTVFEGFEAERAVLGAVGAELVVLHCRSAQDLLTQVGDAHGLLNTYLAGIGAEVFAAAPKLRAVVRYGIGVDTIDIPAATRRGILVANVPDYCVDEVVAGAGLDVLADEAAVVGTAHPLKSFDNVVLTPHSAWFSAAAIPALQRRAAEEMALALSGRRPTSLLNPEAWRGQE